MAGRRTITKRFGILVVAALVFLALAVMEVLASHRSFAGDAEAPWTGHIRAVDQSLANRDVSAAIRSLHSAYLAALGSRRWDSMVAYGDAALRVGDASSRRQVWMEKARQAYLMALFRARNEGSLDGVLRTAQAFQNVGDREVVDLAMRIADQVATASGGSAFAGERSTARGRSSPRDLVIRFDRARTDNAQTAP